MNGKYYDFIIRSRSNGKIRPIAVPLKRPPIRSEYRPMSTIKRGRREANSVGKTRKYYYPAKVVYKHPHPPREEIHIVDQTGSIDLKYAKILKKDREIKYLRKQTRDLIKLLKTTKPRKEAIRVIKQRDKRIQANDSRRSGPVSLQVEAGSSGPSRRSKYTENQHLGNEITPILEQESEFYDRRLIQSYDDTSRKAVKRVPKQYASSRVNQSTQNQRRSQRPRSTYNSRRHPSDLGQSHSNFSPHYQTTKKRVKRVKRKEIHNTSLNTPRRSSHSYSRRVNSRERESHCTCCRINGPRRALTELEFVTLCPIVNNCKGKWKRIYQVLLQLIGPNTSSKSRSKTLARIIAAFDQETLSRKFELFIIEISQSLRARKGISEWQVKGTNFISKIKKFLVKEIANLNVYMEDPAKMIDAAVQRIIELDHTKPLAQTFDKIRQENRSIFEENGEGEESEENQFERQLPSQEEVKGQDLEAEGEVSDHAESLSSDGTPPKRLHQDTNVGSNKHRKHKTSFK